MFLEDNLRHVDSELYLRERSQGVQQHILGFHRTAEQKNVFYRILAM